MKIVRPAVLVLALALLAGCATVSHDVTSEKDAVRIGRDACAGEFAWMQAQEKPALWHAVLQNGAWEVSYTDRQPASGSWHDLDVTVGAKDGAAGLCRSGLVKR
jgi:hypothetical protein